MCYDFLIGFKNIANIHEYLIQQNKVKQNDS